MSRPIHALIFLAATQVKLETATTWRASMEKLFPNWADMLFHGPMKIPVATETSTRWPGLVRFLPWLTVLVILLFTAGIRIHLLEVPLERDEGEYAYAGQLILQGIPPYELAYNMKLPGTYYAYAAGMAVFGQTVAGVHLTLLVVNSLTAVFVFLLGRKMSGVIAGLAGCAAYAIMAASPVVLGLAAHATQFVALFAVPAVWLLWNALATGKRQTLFFSGLLFGLAFLMKQPGICLGFFALAMVTWSAVQKGSLRSRDFLMTLLSLGAGIMLPFAILCLATGVARDFGRFWFWTVKYAGSYAGQSSVAEGGAALGNAILDQLPPYGGFWLLAAAGLLAAARFQDKRKELVFALAFLVFAFLGTTPGLYFRNHYFVLVLPAFALVLGMGLQHLHTLFSARRQLWLAPGLLVLVAGWSVFVQRGLLFELTPIQFNQAIYRGNPFTESPQIGQYIREHSQPEACVAVVGSEPQLYFYARRHSATGYIYTYPLLETQPYASRMQREMINEIQTAKPKFIVLVTYELSWLKKPASDLTIFRAMGQYTRQFYEPVAAVGRRPEDQLALAGGGSTNAPSSVPREAMILYQRKADAK